MKTDNRPFHTVWLQQGLHKPRAVQARLKITKKNVYAELRDGTRKTFNSTFFFTELAAQRRWLGNLDRAAHNRWMCKMPSAVELIRAYQPPRVYHGPRYVDPTAQAAA